MRADGVDSANAGAIPELKPPAFQIIVLVCMEGSLLALPRCEMDASRPVLHVSSSTVLTNLGLCGSDSCFFVLCLNYEC